MQTCSGPTNGGGQPSCLDAAEKTLVDSVLRCCAGDNRRRSRRPKIVEIRTDTEPKIKKNDISVRFGSVRLSVFGDKMPSPKNLAARVDLEQTKVIYNLEQRGAQQSWYLKDVQKD